MSICPTCCRETTSTPRTSGRCCLALGVGESARRPRKEEGSGVPVGEVSPGTQQTLRSERPRAFGPLEIDKLAERTHFSSPEIVWNNTKKRSSSASRARKCRHRGRPVRAAPLPHPRGTESRAKVEACPYTCLALLRIALSDP